MIQTHRVLATLATPVEVIDLDGATGHESWVVRSVLRSTHAAASARVVVRRNGVVVLEADGEVVSKEGQASVVNAVAAPAIDGRIGDVIDYSIQLEGYAPWIEIRLTLMPVKGKRRAVEAELETTGELMMVG